MRQRLIAAALILAAAGTIGCRIDEDKHGDGKNVKIATPFGGMQVKTDNADVLSGIGLPPYPGATLVRKHKDDGDNDSGSADVNMSFGSFQLKVKAIQYRTDDSPEKVFAFYKKALGRFGDVIQCSNDRAIGTPTHTSEGLTCEEDHHSGDSGVHIDTHGSREGISAFEGNAKVQLKAGSKKHQHIVDINPDSGGAKFGLVSLDLPDLNFDSDDSKDKGAGADKDNKQ